MTDAYLTLAELAAYSRLSVRQLRKYLALPPSQALPCYRPGRRVVVRRDEFDAWFQQHRRRGKAVITEVFQKLGLDPLRELRKPLARAVGPSRGAAAPVADHAGDSTQVGALRIQKRRRA